MTPIANTHRRSIQLQLLAYSCLFFLTSCASNTNQAHKPSIPLTPQWTRTADVSPSEPSEWLNDFKSPELNKLINTALANNPSLQNSAGRFAQAIAEAKIAGADRLPSANLGLNGNRQKINNFGPQSVGSTIFETYDLSLNLSWEVDLWGRLRDQKLSAEAQLDASAADFESAKLSLAANVAKMWFQVIAAKQQVDFAEKTAQSYRDNQSTVEARFQKGLSEGLDLRLIRTQTAFAESNVETQKRELDQAIRSLEVLLGEYPAATRKPQIVLPLPPHSIPAGLPSQLLSRRPDIIAAEKRLDAAERSLQAAKKERLPQISLSAAGGTSSQELEDLIDQNFSVWSLGANLAQPIFQGGRITANIEREEALLAQAAATYREVAITAFSEVETTLAAESYLLSEYNTLLAASTEAAAAETLSWERYRGGTTDFLSVLETQRSAVDAQSRLIALRSLLLQNRVDIYLALGGSFQNKKTT